MSRAELQQFAGGYRWWAQQLLCFWMNNERDFGNKLFILFLCELYVTCTLRGGPNYNIPAVNLQNLGNCLEYYYDHFVIYWFRASASENPYDKKDIILSCHIPSSEHYVLAECEDRYWCGYVDVVMHIQLWCVTASVTCHGYCTGKTSVLIVSFHCELFVGVRLSHNVCKITFLCLSQTYLW